MPRLNSRGYVDTGFVKFMTDEQFKACVQYTFLNCTSPSLQMAMLLLEFSGLRVSDIVQLKTTDFNKNDGYRSAYIIQQKTQRPLQFALPGFIADLLQTYINKYSELMINDYLFFPYKNQSENEHIQTSTIRIFVNKMRKELGFNQSYYTTRNGLRLHMISCHTFRHYFLSLAYRRTNDIILCQQLVNHAKIETTARYINRLETAQNRNNIIDQIFSKPT